MLALTGGTLVSASILQLSGGDSYVDLNGARLSATCSTPLQPTFKYLGGVQPASKDHPGGHVPQLSLTTFYCFAPCPHRPSDHEIALSPGARRSQRISLVSATAMQPPVLRSLASRSTVSTLPSSPASTLRLVHPWPMRSRAHPRALYPARAAVVLLPLALTARSPASLTSV
jgi:hypothetical protein